MYITYLENTTKILDKQLQFGRALEKGIWTIMESWTVPRAYNAIKLNDTPTIDDRPVMRSGQSRNGYAATITCVLLNDRRSDKTL